MKDGIRLLAQARGVPLFGGLCERRQLGSYNSQRINDL